MKEVSQQGPTNTTHRCGCGSMLSALYMQEQHISDHTPEN